IRQVLQADALALVCVASRAGEVHRTLSTEEERFAKRQGFLLLRMLELWGDLQSVRLIGDKGRDCADVLRWAPAFRIRLRHELLPVETLQLFHAPDDTSLQIHDPVRIGKVAGQLSKRAFQDSGAFAEIAT